MTVGRIKLFTVPGCGACEAVRDWLTERGIAFEELSVANNLANLRQLRRLTDARRVPVCVAGEQVVVGYDPAALNRLLPCGPRDENHV